MDLKNIGAIIGGIVVGVMLLATILVPIVSTSMITAGDEITMTNTGVSDYVLGRMSGDDEVVIEYTDSGLTLNGEPFTPLTQRQTWAPIAYSDAGELDIRTANYTLRWAVYSEGADTTYISINAAGESVTLTPALVTVYNEGVETEYPVSMIYCVSIEDDDSIAVRDLGGANTAYIKSIKDVLAIGSYTSGENDTMYSVIDGQLTIGNDAYTSSLNYTTTPTSGTTDILTLTSFTITVGEESFTPYNVLVPYEVTGHEDSGALYDLLGIIPLLVTVGILMAVVMWAFARRE